MSDLSPLMTTAEVAAYFRVCPKTIYRWTRDGKLPYSRITEGGQYRYSQTTVHMMMELINVQRHKPHKKRNANG